MNVQVWAGSALRGQQPQGTGTKTPTGIRCAITGSKEEAIHCQTPHTWILAKQAPEESSREPLAQRHQHESASAASTCWVMPALRVFTLTQESSRNITQTCKSKLQHCSAPPPHSDLDSLHRHPHAAGQKAKQSKLLSLPKRHSRQAGWTLRHC